MPRVAASPDRDPTSPIMSRAATARYLGLSDGQIRTLIKDGQLTPDRQLGTFASKQVIQLAIEIERRIMYDADRGTSVGREQSAMGNKPGLRKKPALV